MDTSGRRHNSSDSPLDKVLRTLRFKVDVGKEAESECRSEALASNTFFGRKSRSDGVQGLMHLSYHSRLSLKAMETREVEEDELQEAVTELREMSYKCRSFVAPGLNSLQPQKESLLASKVKISVAPPCMVSITQEEREERESAQAAARAAWHQQRQHQQQGQQDPSNVPDSPANSPSGFHCPVGKHSMAEEEVVVRPKGSSRHLSVPHYLLEDTSERHSSAVHSNSERLSATLARSSQPSPAQKLPPLPSFPPTHSAPHSPSSVTAVQGLAPWQQLQQAKQPGMLPHLPSKPPAITADCASLERLVPASFPPPIRLTPLPSQEICLNLQAEEGVVQHSSLLDPQFSTLPTSSDPIYFSFDKPLAELPSGADPRRGLIQEREGDKGRTRQSGSRYCSPFEIAAAPNAAPCTAEPVSPHAAEDIAVTAITGTSISSATSLAPADTSPAPAKDVSYKQEPPPQLAVGKLTPSNLDHRTSLPFMASPSALFKHKGCLQARTVADNKLNATRLAPETYPRKLEVESRCNSSCLGRFNAGGRRRRQGSLTMQEAASGRVSRKAGISPAGTCQDMSMAGSGSLATMLAQFAAEKKELQLLREHSRVAKPACSTAQLDWH